MSKKEKKKIVYDDVPVTLDIPDDEIWTYQVPGLAAPHINKPYKNPRLKKFIFIAVIVVAVSLSCYFSIRTVKSDTFDYTPIKNESYELTKFSNTGFITELTVDKVQSLVYQENNGDPNTNFDLVDDESKTITEIRDYAFNCDEKLKTIYIGADVEKIGGKAFYSCWNLEAVFVDKNNPYYCDIDGVVYTKDMTEIIFYPVNHDAYLCEKYGYKQYNDKGEWIEPAPDSKEYEGYKRDVLTYVIPSTVTKIGELSMNYAYIEDIYIPEGVKSIETLAFFKATKLLNVYSYKTDKTVLNTHFEGADALGDIYYSLPEGLEYIGSDAFSYDQGLSYVYIPESVTYIGHHAFWDTVYKEDGELKAVTEINVARSEESFNDVAQGDHWKPQYDYMLFKKYVEVKYGTERNGMDNL